ncbi:MAG: hypothetical protein GY811_02435 [Myxococcales bacterium]|nr:hypothetical protein [Myxococcales bacterium]
MLRYALWSAAAMALQVVAAHPAHSQRPTAKVTSRADVNGDSRADEVRIDVDGSITVHIVGDESAGAWTPLAASGKVVGGSIHIDRTLAPGRTVILATSNLGRRGGRSFTEAVALAWSPGKLETLWRGKLGSQGPDGGSKLSIELGQYGLIKYASRIGVSRCDGETAHLDAERYDFATGRFRPARQALRMGAADTRPTLVASKSRPEFIPEGSRPFWFRAQGASSSGTAANAAELVPPAAVADGNDATAWTENKGGVGVGEFVTLRSSLGEVNVKALRLFLGHGSAQRDFNRPKRLGLILGDSELFWIDIPKDPRVPQWIVLPKPVASACVTLVLDKVYPQRALAQTAISEITIYSEEELDPKRAATLLAKRIAKGKSRADTNRLLARLGPSASDALLSEISKAQRSGDPDMHRQMTNLRLALASIPEAPVEVVAGLADDALRPVQHSVFSQALLSMQGNSIAPLTQGLLDSGLSAHATSRIASVLADMPQPQAALALLGATGNGNQPTRSAVIKALAQRPDAWQHLPAALSPQNTATKEADLFRAMGLAAAQYSATSEERAALATEVASAASNARGLGYEERYRILTAAGLLGGSKNADALISQIDLLGDREDAEGIALLRRAVTSLAKVTGAEGTALKGRARAVLLSSLGHKDPGVRLALLSSLEASAAPEGSIERRLREDSWPEVRRSAAAALSTRCDDASAVALTKASLEDANTKVARSAFGGFLRCDSAGRFDLALQLVNLEGRPLELRLHAARVLGELASESQATLVIQRFSKARRRALGDRKSGKLASALSRSLADLGGPRAVRALESSAADPAFPQLQSAAISALGTLCPASSRQLFQRLRQSHEGNVAAAATRAARQCAER